MNINNILIETNQTRPHMTIFFLIDWKQLRRFSLSMNSAKILSEKDKKNRGSTLYSKSNNKTLVDTYVLYVGIIGTINIIIIILVITSNNTIYAT